MRRIVVVGGGISGLAAAHAAHDELVAAGARGSVAVLVLEREPFVGGKAVATRDGDWLVEGGPSAYLDGEPALDRLVAIAGIEPLRANRDAARRYVVRAGRPRELVPHPLGLVRNGILSPLGVARLACERFLRPRRDGAEESVRSFVRRRCGAEVAARLVGPFVSGVVAGDPARISLDAAFPRLRAMEREHGSLSKALAARRRAQHAGGPVVPAGGLTSFRDGLSALPRALARSERIAVRTGVAVHGVAGYPHNAQYALSLDGGESLRADALIVATEAWSATAVLRTIAPEAALELDAVRGPPVVVVGLGYGREAEARCPRGFGALVPRGEGLRLLGMTWESRIFASRAPDGGLLVRAMFGGATDPDVVGVGADALIATAEREVSVVLGLASPPVYRTIRIWPRAIPQPELGHLARAARVAAALDRASGSIAPLFLAGNAFGGVSFSAAAATGSRAGLAAARALLSGDFRDVPR